jgi:hypothetical protein
MSGTLLERDSELDELRAAVQEATAGRGRVVLLHGEAGIGKTSLVNALRAEPPDGVRVLVGSCDAMSTPRTLGPLRDLAPAVGPRLREALRAGDREEVYAALRDELADAYCTVLIVEDVHWADEATLDVLRYLARRIDDLPAVLVLTYRDELDRDHPLNRLLGDLGHGDRVDRIALPHLSAAAVGALTADSGLDADRVYRMTEGNPYFVSELVASADEARVPPTVVDAVTGRLRRLDGATQDHVEQLAVVPSGDRPRPARPARAGVGGARSAPRRRADCSPSAPTASGSVTNSPAARSSTRSPRHGASSSNAGRSLRSWPPASPIPRGSCTTRSPRATSMPWRSGRRVRHGMPPRRARTARPPRTTVRRSTTPTASSRTSGPTCGRRSRSSRTRSARAATRWSRRPRPSPCDDSSATSVGSARACAGSRASCGSAVAAPTRRQPLVRRPPCWPMPATRACSPWP